MYDVIIVGSGPAGLTAAIYTTRANLKTLIISGAKWGGQLQLTTLVENYPGFPEGIQGPDLMTAMRKQAEHHGAEFVDDDLSPTDFTSQKPGGNFVLKVGEKAYEGKTILIATGADTKWLGVPGEAERIGRGVSSCAPCDAPFFRNKNVIVVGGGDSAMEEAYVLAQFAEHVTIIYRGETFRASQFTQERCKKHPKISFIYNTEITEILGEGKVEKVKLTTKFPISNFKFQINATIINDQNNEKTWEMAIDGVFVAIGHIPNTKIFQGIELKDGGYVKPQDRTKTNIEGVFVSGDVEDDRYRQAVTAAGFGCMSPLDIRKDLMRIM